MASAAQERALTFVLPALAAAVFLGGWQTVARVWAVPAVIMPAPTDVLRELAGQWADLLLQAAYTGSELDFGHLGGIASCPHQGVYCRSRDFDESRSVCGDVKTRSGPEFTADKGKCITEGR